MWEEEEEKGTKRTGRRAKDEEITAPSPPPPSPSLPVFVHAMCNVQNIAM